MVYVAMFASNLFCHLGTCVTLLFFSVPFDVSLVHINAEKYIKT